MRVVKKHQPGKFLRVLTPEEKAALCAVLGKGEGSEKQKQITKILLQWIRDREAWLECDCQTNTKPLMTVALAQTGKLHIRRMNHRGEHGQDCLYKTIDSEESVGSTIGNTRVWDKSQPIQFHRSSSLNEEVSQGNSQDSSARSRDPRFAQVLYAWIREARLNELPIKQPLTIAESYQRLRQATQGSKLHSKVDIDNFFWTYPNLARIQQSLEKNQHLWPKNSRPFAICVAVADRVEDNACYFRFKKETVQIRLTGKTLFSSGRLGKKSPPYLIIFSVTNTVKQPNKYLPMNAFCVPVYSKSLLIPVDSRYERKVLQLLEQRAQWWVNTKGLTVTIKKPLEDSEGTVDNTLQLYRPDFVIETPKKKIFFEVMGSDESIYLERKRRTIQAMREVGEVVEFDALNADRTNTWDEQLKKKISQISALVFRGNKK